MAVSTLLIVLIATLGSVLLGVFTYTKNYRSQTHIFFLLFALTISAYNVANFIALQQPVSQLSLFWIKIVMLLALLINLFFLYLASSFPSQTLKLPRKFFYSALLVTAVLIPLSQTSLLFQSAEAYGNNPTPGPLMPFFLIHTILFLGGGFLQVVKNLRTLVGIEQKQVQLFLFANIAMFAAILFTNVLLVLVFQNVKLVGLLPIYTLVFIATISFAILRYKLLDINAFVARSVAFSITVGLISSGYAGFLFIGMKYLLGVEYSSFTIVLSVLTALFFAASFQPLARKIASLTDRVFYKGFYDPSKLLYDTSVILASTLYLEDIIHDTLEKILLEMKIQDGSFVLTEEGKIYQVAAEGKDQDGLTYDESELQLLLTEKNVFDINAVSDRRIKSLLKKLGVEVVVTLFQEGKHLGWCFLGPKLSGEMYSTKDFRVLEILAPQIAVAIQNAKSYEEIRRFNITLEKEVDQATKRLVIANNKLQELDKLKDEFVSVASHELRTPMTAIKSYLWMALQGKGGDLTTKQKYYLERAYSSTDRLIKLVNEMLNISRIESGRIALQVSKVELFDLLKEVIAEVLPRAQELELTISLKRSVQGDHGDGQRSIQVLADVDKCKEVLINLIGNSLKFTPKGGKITLEVSQDSATEVSVHVHDTGVGIAPEYVPSLFQKFGLIEGSYQTNQAASQGTGLGLFISKSIVELHGGKIWMESAGVGKGATFSFTLPIYSAAREKMFRKKFDETTDAGIIRNTL